MSSQTPIFLPPNNFPRESAYSASLIASNGSISTLALQCMNDAKASASVSGCGSPVTVTVAPTTFRVTTTSTQDHTPTTFVQSCMMVPAKSTASCAVTAIGGVHLPATYNPSMYAAALHTVNITNVAASTSTSSSGSTGTATATASSSSSTSTSTSSATTTNSVSKIFILALCALSAFSWA